MTIIAQNRIYCALGSCSWYTNDDAGCLDRRSDHEDKHRMFIPKTPQGVSTVIRIKKPVPTKPPTE